MKYLINYPRFIKSISAILLVLVFGLCYGQDSANAGKQQRIEYGPFNANTGHWYSIADSKNMINALPNRPRCQPTDLVNIGDNILLFQKANGGWPKNYDMFAKLTDDQKQAVTAKKNDLSTTFDNGTCYTQIAALATVYNATKAEKYKKGTLDGLDYILNAQYANGGWPQYYPLEEGYSREITYNDGVMEGIMSLLKDIIDHKPIYAFVVGKCRLKLQKAFDKGLDCILKTQINDVGKPTAWCQQYDEITLQPAWARKFEPPSICNGESSDIVLFLMRIKKPSKPIIEAVQNAVAWFQESEIYNTKVLTVPAPEMQTPYRISRKDRVVMIDSTAPPIWTRYYELKTHKPIFCNRDSKIVYSLAEVSRERRDGYSWYNYKPQKVLNKYKQWQQKWAVGNNVLAKE
ncbi:pectate lyase [Parasediminibacterium sp. JCM 36343]|uniref:pectate lyase n=1 Tax=Parasediminibacterium sp. JCM 36343 TaxID=3374279 RepID=UPI00397E2C5C